MSVPVVALDSDGIACLTRMYHSQGFRRLLVVWLKQGAALSLPGCTSLEQTQIDYAHLITTHFLFVFEICFSKNFQFLLKNLTNQFVFCLQILQDIANFYFC